MVRLIVLLGIAVIISFASSPAYTADVYKWVDADGITYYSDEAPPVSPNPISLIELTATYPVTVDPEKDFYSITNQWQRLNRARIEREKLKLERIKLEEAQQPVTPQIVYNGEPQDKQYIIAYPGTTYHRHGHKRFFRKGRHHIIGMHKKRLKESRPGKMHSGKLSLGSYRRPK